ncbi:hypothetical protein AAVH_09605 [Aphelenchoides avenae]|nr:hypothetical protein AAVH_09605 [Aphelenchus avenae]
MQERLNNAERPYPVAELQKIHEAALEGARETFADKCMGKDRHKAPHLQKMGKLIAVEHAAFKKANANLAVPIANNVYVAFWNDFIASEKHDWSHYHLKQDAFADKDGQHRNAAVKKFNEFAVKDEESSRDALKKLEHMLKISMLKRKVVNGVKCYKHHMTTAQNSVEPWITSRLQSCHKEAKKQAVDEADLNRSRWARDGEFAMAREDLKRQIKVAKASFIPPDMPGDKNSNAWDQAIAHYIKRMDRICKPYETPYVEANVFIQENARYIDEAKALFEDRCAKDGQTDEFRKTLLQELARQQVEFEKVNSKNWWWDGWKTVSTLVGSVYDDCMHLLGFD